MTKMEKRKVARRFRHYRRLYRRLDRKSDQDVLGDLFERVCALEEEILGVFGLSSTPDNVAILHTGVHYDGASPSMLIELLETKGSQLDNLAADCQAV